MFNWFWTRFSLGAPEYLITRFRHYYILAKTRSRMMTATTFSRQNDAGSRARTTYYWENLVLVVLPVLESKGL